MKKVLLYVHGKGGSAAEAEQYRKNCPDADVIGVDYFGDKPWQVLPQIRAVYDTAQSQYDKIYLLANSIGAYFSMLALEQCRLEKALFISPILDMEQLIRTMMTWANVSETQLHSAGEIPTDFGETLSWEYLCFVREHPICWTIPTEILYAAGDHLTSRQTVDAFLQNHPAHLTVLENGEHWFHTPEQLAFLDRWMTRVLS